LIVDGYGCVVPVIMDVVGEAKKGHAREEVAAKQLLMVNPS
jgi:hypothetical protein